MKEKRCRISQMFSFYIAQFFILLIYANYTNQSVLYTRISVYKYNTWTSYYVLIEIILGKPLSKKIEDTYDTGTRIDLDGKLWNFRPNLAQQRDIDIRSSRHVTCRAVSTCTENDRTESYGIVLSTTTFSNESDEEWVSPPPLLTWRVRITIIIIIAIRTPDLIVARENTVLKTSCSAPGHYDVVRKRILSTIICPVAACIIIIIFV